MPTTLRPFNVPARLPLSALESIRRTSGALDFQNALFPAVILERADKWGSHNEDSPLSVCRRLCLGTRRRRGVDDILVAAGDVGPVGGRVERGHGGVRGRGDGRSYAVRWRGRREGEESELGRKLSQCAQCGWQALCGCSYGAAYGAAYAYSRCVMYSWATALYTASRRRWPTAKLVVIRGGAESRQPQAAVLPHSLVGWHTQQHLEPDRQHRRRLSSTTIPLLQPARPYTTHIIVSRPLDIPCLLRSNPLDLTSVVAPAVPRLDIPTQSHVSTTIDT